MQHAPEQNSEVVQSEKFNSRWQQANVHSALSAKYHLYFFLPYITKYYSSIMTLSFKRQKKTEDCEIFPTDSFHKCLLKQSYQNLYSWTRTCINPQSTSGFQAVNYLYAAKIVHVYSFFDCWADLIKTFVMYWRFSLGSWNRLAKIISLDKPESSCEKMQHCQSG